MSEIPGKTIHNTIRGLVGIRQNLKEVKGLKASKYNISIPSEKDNYLMVNTLTTAVLSIQEPPSSPVHSALLNSETLFNYSLDEVTLKLLLDHGFLVAKEFDELKWLEKLHWQSREGNKALGIGIAVTLGCNFRCIYCYQGHQNVHFPKKLEGPLVNFVAENLKEKLLLRMMWIGGEPLIRLETICRISQKLLELAKAQNIDYEGAMVTNGFLLTPKTTRVLLEAGIDDVQITLDGPPSIHDKRRFLANGKPTFERILSNLMDAARMLRRVIVRINIDKRNQNEILELLEYLQPLKKDIVLAFRAATSPESPQIGESWCIMPNSYWDLHEKLRSTADKQGFSVITGYAIPGTSFCSGYQKNSFTFDPYGDVHLCPICIGRRDQRYGNLTVYGRIKLKNGIQNQWEKWSPFIDNDCRDCKALPVCMGGCLWYISQKDKAASLRCFARHKLPEGIIKDPLFRGWVRAFRQKKKGGEQEEWEDIEF